MSINSVPKNTLQKLFEPMIVSELSKTEVLDKIKSDAVNYSKVNLLIEQMCFLKQQLENTINEGLLNTNLHNVECKFEKKSGQVYHLYKNCNKYYFSMLSIDDWNNNPPHTYISSYLYDYDKCFRHV